MKFRALLVFVLPAVILVAAALYSAPQQVPQPHHLTKIDGSGKALSAWSGPWSCVCDDRTQLLWEVKTDDEGIHDGYWTYSWYQYEQGVANSGDCYFEKARCDTEDLIRHTNRQKLCGAENWRLPTTDELQSLVIADPIPGHPAVDTDYFPRTKRGDYWTSDGNQPLQGVYQYLKRGSRAINFINGDAVTIPYRNAAFVRLVADNSNACHKARQ
ncbi:DUF1566 domain-containing protein [Microbulbifer taiwanensis]|uniref:DUF1566 domain-containing protein n=1 Tax=Microbulbifer taiwanensis TaxID=986746 RepID=A0ABW1YLR5_9GAMM|nr:DUF1566 domain-containing protein [Microbulbifer taiwanensis]